MSNRSGGAVMPPARVPSPASGLPGPNSRPSISSVRSGRSGQSGRSGGPGRKTIEDFESALRNPDEVIYLSSSPVFQQEASHLIGSPHRDDDEGRVSPRASFDQDMRRGSAQSNDHAHGHSRNGHANGLSHIHLGQGHFNNHPYGHDRGFLGTPSRGPSTHVVPPTPSSISSAHSGRRESIVSNDSGKGSTSGVSARVASMKMNQSLGLDAELSAVEAASTPSKRRSIFRSPGTASSPDLATLVRRAKEKNVKASIPPNITPIPPTRSSSPPSTVSSRMQPRTQYNHHPTAQPTVKLDRTISPTKTSSVKESPVTHPVPAPITARVPLQTVAFSRPTPPPPLAPSLPPAPEVAVPPPLVTPTSVVTPAPVVPLLPPQTVASVQQSPPPPAQRAKPTAPASPVRSTTSRGTIVSSPSLTSSTRESVSSPKTTPRRAQVISHGLDVEWDIAEKDSKNKSTKSRGMFGRLFGGTTKDLPSPPSKPRAPIPPMPPMPADHSSNKGLAPAAKVSDVFSRVDSSTSSRGIDPSAIPRSSSLITTVSVEQPSSIESQSIRRTSHIRQPAVTDSSSIDEHKREREPSFSEDVAGILDRIGNVEPAKELGLPAESLRVSGPKDEVPRKTSTASTTEIIGLSSAIQPIPENSVLTVETSPVIVSSMATIEPSPTMSQVSKSPLTLSPVVGQLSTPATITENDGLVPAPVPLSRSSSSASARQTERTITPVEDSSRSVRLVSSPRPPSVYSNRTLNLTSDGLARSHFASTVPWGKQSPRTSSGGTPSEDVTASPSQGPVTEDEDDQGRQLACEFLENDPTHVAPDKVAEFLGGPRRINAIALKYYMQYFDMRSQKLDQAFRELCAKLHLKAESQEIDRIIEAFSARYFECNPTTVFGTPGVVHTVTAAMLMLNTDLHIADLSKHMSRADFVRNAMRAIQESMPERASTPDLVWDDGSSSRLDSTIARKVSRTETQRSTSSQIDELKSGTSSTTSFNYSRAWEVEAENALREIYANVRIDRILLPISTPTSEYASTTSLPRPSTLRSPSGRSDRLNPLKRTSIRGNSPYGAGFSVSDGRLSPTPSYANSIGDQYQALAPALGFASNLSHAVIREAEDETHSQSSQVSASTLDDMNDDELALLGAPWAKEGLLDRKLQPTEPGRSKLQKKDWKQYFVVIGKGELHMFVFGEGSSSSGGTVGGGNWLTNARATGEFSLMHATAMSLPRSGYSSSRPHCFTVTLPNGDINIFAAGTEDLVVEWVAACNYWAARISRPPLQGGVSNMEYGWTRALDHRDEEDRASVRSARSNLSRLGGTYGRRGFGNTPADKMHVNEWKPPPHATMPSPLDEETQVETLQAYVRSLKEELAQHKLVEEPMQRLYTPGSKNSAKARDNWLAKSKYIHSEIFKYETYVESLRAAIGLRVKKQGEKKLERSLARSMASLTVDEEEGEDDRVFVASEEVRVDPTEGIDLDDGRATPLGGAGAGAGEGGTHGTGIIN